MAKQYPDYMGSYKAVVVETGVGETKSGYPQFIVKTLLTAYFDQKENEWFDVSDNGWSMTAYLNLIGRKGGAEDGEPVRTLNFAQVMSVFEWDGAGLGYLQSTDFKGKEIQVRVAPNTGEGAKTPCQIAWIDIAGADPNNTLRSLDEDKVKALESKFSGLWESRKITPATAKKTTKSAKKAPPTPPSAEPEHPTPKTDAERKAEILAKGKRLLAKNKAEAAPPAPTAKGKKAPPEPPAEKEEAPADDIPPEYGKKDAWNDVIDCKAEECTDEQLMSAWKQAILDIAPDGDEDELDNAGWFAVKEQVLAEIGKF